MTILAIDPGTHTGWATWDGTLRDSGTWDNPHSHAKWPGSFFSAYRDWLADMQQWHQPQSVWVAETFSRSTAAQKVLYGMRAITLNWATRHKIERPQSVAESTARKVVLGNGRVPKDAIIALVRARFGWKGTSHDEADAIVILEYAKLKGEQTECQH